MRPSLEHLRTLQTIPCDDAVDGWDLKMVSPQYKLRFWFGSYVTSCSEFHAVAVDWQTTNGEWVQVDYYDRNDYD